MAWKGTYSGSTSYSNGDEVVYTVSNVDRYFIYINAAAGSGHAPTNNAYWAEASLVVYNSDGTVLKLLIVDDNSYRTRTIMGDHQLVLYFSSPTHIEIPLGAYVDFQSTRYTLERPEALKMKHSRLFEYTVTLDAYQSMAKRWKFRNTVDGRLSFPLTATPREHLQMFVDNMNRRDTGWAIGSCIEGVEHLISYDHAYCYEALQQMAEEFDTEFEIVNKTVSLHKVEYNKAAPLSLSYGKGNGFKPNVGRSNSSDSLPVEILFVQGGEDNIDKSTYGNAALLLPASQSLGYDGSKFSDQTGYVAANARQYVVSSDGLSIQRSDKTLSSKAEDSLDCTDIFPKRVGKVGQVIVVDADNNFYDFTDLNAASDPCPDYEDYLIDGETMTVKFQSGMLAGREFEVKYVHDAKTVKGVAKLGRRFEIVPQEIDGVTMPDATYKPAANDKYIVLHCAMPQSYICDNVNKCGASWDMLRTAVKYLYDNEEQKFSFSGILDGIWAKADWTNRGGKIVLGGYISFTDTRFQSTAVLVRITAIKDYINNPHSPEITISNETVTPGFSSEIKNIESDTEVVSSENLRQGIQFTKRRFRDAQETMKMLEESLIEGYTQSISPVAAQMLQLLVGDDSLQFRFVSDYSAASPTVITPTFAFSSTTGKFTVNGGYYLQHLTLGINTLKTSHAVNEYKWWSVLAYESAVLTDGDKTYYVYLKCPTGASCNCEYVLSETAIGMTSVSGYYHFLVGVLNSEYEGGRSFTSLYGFTEITGGRITTDKIVSSDNNSFLDLVSNAFQLGSKLKFNVSNDGKLVLNGAFVQTGSGTTETIGAWCGLYDSTRTYKLGDEVYAVINGKTSSYRYVNSEPSSGHPVTDASYWIVFAAGVKGDSGDPGTNGYNTAVVYLYQRSATALTVDWTIDLTYSFTRKALTSVPSRWSETIPADNGNPLYVTAATASSRTDTDDIAYTEWAAPVILAEDGSDGLNSATVTLYKRAASSPAKPSTALTYTFATGILSGTLDGWSQTIPEADGNPCYVIQATAISTSSTDTIAASEWSEVRKLVEDGNDGRGISSTEIKYAVDSQGTTPPSLWQDAIPSVPAGCYLWTRTTVNYTSGDPSVSYSVSRAGTDGDNGSSIKFLYKSQDTQPSAPTGTDPSPSGWSESPTAGQSTVSTSKTYKGNWVLQTSGDDNGYYVADTIADNTQTTESILLTTPRDNVYVRLSLRLASEASFDNLYVGYVDDKMTIEFYDDEQPYVSNYAHRLQCQTSGVQVTDEYTFLVKRAGQHRIDIAFVKDYSTSSVPEKAAFKVAATYAEMKVWMTSCKVQDGSASGWTTPICINGENGSSGIDGSACPYRGVYSSTAVYFGLSSRTDIVQYTSNGVTKYYRANPCVGGSFTGIIPTNTAYWMDFGAQFDNIATGFLFAEEAVIEKAVIRKLRTSDTGARVLAEGNALTMMDADGTTKLKIFGSDLEDALSDSTLTVVTSGNIIDESYTVLQINNGIDLDGSTTVSFINGASTIGTFTVAAEVNVVQIPTLVIRMTNTIGTQGATVGGMGWDGDLKLVVDDMTEASFEMSFDIERNTTEGGSKTQDITLTGLKLSLSKGSHTLKVVYNTYIWGSGFGTDSTPSFEAVITSATNLVISYPVQITAIGANGFRAMFSGSQYADFVSNNGTPEFTIRSGNAGIKLTNGTLKMMFDGSTWYTASRAYVSDGYYLKLS